MGKYKPISGGPGNPWSPEIGIVHLMNLATQHDASVQNEAGVEDEAPVQNEDTLQFDPPYCVTPQKGDFRSIYRSAFVIRGKGTFYVSTDLKRLNEYYPNLPDGVSSSTLSIMLQEGETANISLDIMSNNGTLKFDCEVAGADDSPAIITSYTVRLYDKNNNLIHEGDSYDRYRMDTKFPEEFVLELDTLLVKDPNDRYKLVYGNHNLHFKVVSGTPVVVSFGEMYHSQNRTTAGITIRTIPQMINLGVTPPEYIDNKLRRRPKKISNSDKVLVPPICKKHANNPRSQSDPKTSPQSTPETNSQSYNM